LRLGSHGPAAELAEVVRSPTPIDAGAAFEGRARAPRTGNAWAGAPGPQPSALKQARLATTAQPLVGCNELCARDRWERQVGVSCGIYFKPLRGQYQKPTSMSPRDAASSNQSFTSTNMASTS
jgi:hypothetical protein